jgi:multiple sugar transport system permease protein
MITRRFRSSVDKHHVSPASLTLVMFIYDQGFKFLSLGLASAGAWILFVIILGVTALQFRGQKRWVHYDV